MSRVCTLQFLVGQVGLESTTNGLKIEAIEITLFISIGYVAAETVCNKVCKQPGLNLNDNNLSH